MAADSGFKAKPDDKNRNVNSKVWSAWQEYLIALAESLSDCINQKFEALSQAVCEQIRADAVRFSRLGDTDEEIYAHLVALMGVYRRVVELADSLPFEDPLVDGICEVLNSRLREFETDAKQTDGNPVKAEKTDALDETLSQASAAITEMNETFAMSLPRDNIGGWDESFEMILRGDFYNMYQIYRNGLKLCLARLDDLHSRKTARFYTELIEREFEELGNIVKLQSAGRADCSILCESEQGEDISPVLLATAGILDALNEAHQLTEPIIKNFQTRQNAPPEKSLPCRSFDDFEHELETALEAAVPQLQQKKNFFAALDTEVMALIDGTRHEYKRAAYSLQRLISADTLLADEIINVFTKTLRDLSQEGEDIERDILMGIRESIDIKISGLQESLENFTRQNSDILKDFSTEKNSPPNGEYEAILESIRDAWLNSPPVAECIAEFLDAQQNSETFKPCRERVEKQVSHYTDIIEKSSFRFKKEVLLYEVCTFEEILTHSVSRLHESKDDGVLSAAFLLDSAFRELEVILKKNNIAVIRPAAKELFNASEHEVLVAEKHNHFEKGEIIKVITAGYRLKEKVILRANVVAAR